MRQIHIKPLDPIKLPLVQKLYKAFYPSAKPKRDELILTAYLQSELAAVVRFRQIDQYRLMTGMLVIPKYRGQSVGEQLLSYCQQQVLNSRDFCFAYPYLESYYSKYGFVKHENEPLPAEINLLYERYTASGKPLTAMQFISDCRAQTK